MTTHTDSLASRAAGLATVLCSDASAVRSWRHVDLVLATTSLVRSHGAAYAIDVLRAQTPHHHETRAGFMVWAIDRLISAGASTIAVLWHPLVNPEAALSWWTADDLAFTAARFEWVEPTLALAGEPSPTFLGTSSIRQPIAA